MATTDRQLPAWETLRQMYGFIARRDGIDQASLVDSELGLDAADIDALRAAELLTDRDGELYLGVPAVSGADAEETIRVARQEDLPEIEDVIAGVTAERTYVEAESVAEELDRDETLIRFDEATSRIVFVAEVDGEIVAWLHIESPEREKLRHTAQFTVGVGEAYRGRGIGKRLMTSGLRWAELHGYRKVYNDFPATNRGALAFLDVLDYDAHCEAVHRDHYLIDDEFVDQMTLAIYLSSGPETQTHFDRVQQEAEEIY